MERSVYIKFYVTEGQRHDGTLLYHWLLEQAETLDLPGGSAFRAIAGYGRHGRAHDESFFELAGDLPVQVEFVLSETLADRLVEALRAHKLHLLYVRYPVETGIV